MKYVMIIALLAGFSTVSRAQQVQSFDKDFVYVPFKTTWNTEPLYFADSVAITSEQAKNMDPGKIRIINVIPGAKAIEQYGVRGQNGVVILVTKTTSFTEEFLSRKRSFPTN